MSNRILLSVAIGVLTVAVMLTALLSGSAWAQDATPDPPTGKLVVAPQSVEQGETTLAVGFHVEPSDTEVKIEYSGHFTPEGESCDSAGSPGATSSAVAPTWITLNACAVGEGYARLVVSDTGHVIETVNVTVAEPTASGQGEGGEGDPVLRLRGVASSMDVGDSDDFTVNVGRLNRDSAYVLYMESLDMSSLAFDRGCSDFTKTVNVRGVFTYSGSHTMYACDAPGTDLFVYLQLDGNTVASSGLGANYVTVAEAPTPTPTDTPTPVPPTPEPPTPEPPDPPAPPTPRPTSTPTPAPVPDKVVNLSGTPGPAHGQITLRWDAADHATGYQVRQRNLPNQWTALPSGGFTVTISRTTAVVRNLDPDTTYEHQVRGTNANRNGEWSDSVETTPRDERPAIPTGLTGVTMRGGRGITLSWHEVTGAASYEVESSFGGNTAIHTVSTESIPLVGMTPGTVYGFRVRAKNIYGDSDWSSAVSYTAPTPTLWEGHQEDHTVAYRAGSIVSSSGLPAGVPDPATVISTAIDPAAEAWTNEATAIAGKNLKICKAGVGVGACGVSNHDGGIVTVKTEDTNTKDAGAASHDPNEGCGSSAACVKVGIPSSSSPSSNGPGNHLGNLWIIIEEPAWDCSPINPVSGVCQPGRHVRVYWTDKSGLDLAPGPRPDTEYHYIGSVMIHEFGHTLGLPDFYSDTITNLIGLPAVMDNQHTNKTITDEDIAQLRAIYAVHDSSDH